MEELLLVLEILSVLCNTIFIWLIIKENRIGWLVGVLGSALSVVLFYYQSYYSESLLSLFYVVVGLYGFMIWGKGSSLKISVWRRVWHVLALFLGSCAAMLLGWRMGKIGADRSYADAFSTVFSILATFLETYKILSAWLYWIVINLFNVWFYGVKGMYIYSTLMLVYFVMSIQGYMNWKKSMKEKESERSVEGL